MASCSDAHVSEARGPNDSEGWLEITCRQDQDNCYDKAREVCDGVYEVADNRGRYAPSQGAPLYSGSMLIRCQEQGGEAAPRQQAPGTERAR